MGLRPREVDALSLWEYSALFTHWQRAHDPKKQGAGIDEDDMQAFEQLGVFEPVILDG